MAKRKVDSPIEGRWNIISMTAWELEEAVEGLQPFIEFERNDGGRFQFGCVYGEMDCRITERDGKPAAEFSWEGQDEDEQAFGRGWAVLDGDDLTGMILFHHGDESGFVAKMQKR
ncbi:MAG: hypothetical protein ACYTG0_01420 [Planctomycetota bacterium]